MTGALPGIEALGDLRGTRVLVRCDLNVPLDGARITDDGRIRASLPTLQRLRAGGARVTVLSHLGRPNGAPDPRYSLEPVARRLAELLGHGVEVVAGAGDPGGAEIVVRENLRFDPAETSKDPAERAALAHRLAGTADAYVDDAFGAMHRRHASVYELARLLPHAAGDLVQREVAVLRELTETPNRPFALVLGGSKVSDKLAVIERLLPKVDRLLVGGGMCFTFLAAQGAGIGASLLEADQIAACRRFLDSAKVTLPVDVVVAREVEAGADLEVVAADRIPDGWIGLDIGPETVKVFGRRLADARTVFWNGPMGVFEIPALRRGDPRRGRGGRLAARGADGGRRRRLGWPRFAGARGGREAVRPHLDRWWGQPGLPRGPAVARTHGAGGLVPDRTPLMAGNWKMNLNHLEAIALVQKLAFSFTDKDFDGTDIAVLPPFTDIRSVQTMVDGDHLRIAYGGQDISPHDSGAYTGDISGLMLAKLGCTFVLVGHSERRAHHGDSDDLVNAKLAGGLPQPAGPDPVRRRAAGGARGPACTSAHHRPAAGRAGGRHRRPGPIGRGGLRADLGDRDRGGGLARGRPTDVPRASRDARLPVRRPGRGRRPDPVRRLGETGQRGRNHGAA